MADLADLQQARCPDCGVSLGSLSPEHAADCHYPWKLAQLQRNLGADARRSQALYNRIGSVPYESREGHSAQQGSDTTTPTPPIAPRAGKQQQGPLYKPPACPHCRQDLSDENMKRLIGLWRLSKRLAPPNGGRPPVPTACARCGELQASAGEARVHCISPAPSAVSAPPSSAP